MLLKEEKEIVNLIKKKIDESKLKTTLLDLEKEKFLDGLIIDSFSTEKDKPYFRVNLLKRTVSYPEKIKAHNTCQRHSSSIRIFLESRTETISTKPVVDIIKYSHYTIITFYTATIKLDFNKINNREYYDETLIDDIGVECKKEISDLILIINDAKNELYISKKDINDLVYIENATKRFKHDFDVFMSWYRNYQHYTGEVFDNYNNIDIFLKYFPDMDLNENRRNNFWNYILKVFINSESKFILNKLGKTVEDNIQKNIKAKIKIEDIENNIRYNFLSINSNSNNSSHDSYFMLANNYYDFFPVNDTVVGIKYHIISQKYEPGCDVNIMVDSYIELKKDCSYKVVNMPLSNKYVVPYRENIILPSREELNDCFSKIDINYEDWLFYITNYTVHSNYETLFLINIFSSCKTKELEYFLSPQLRFFSKKLSSLTRNREMFEFLWSNRVNEKGSTLEKIFQIPQEKILYFIESMNELEQSNEQLLLDRYYIYFDTIKLCSEEITFTDIKEMDYQYIKVITFFCQYKIKFSLKELFQYKERVIYAQGKTEKNWSDCFVNYMLSAYNMGLDLTDKKIVYSNMLDMDTAILQSAKKVFSLNADRYLSDLKKYSLCKNCNYIYKENKYYISKCKDIKEAFNLSVNLKHNMGLMVSEVEDDDFLYFKITDNDDSLKYILKYDHHRRCVDSCLGMKNSKVPKDEEKFILLALKFK